MPCHDNAMRTLFTPPPPSLTPDRPYLANYDITIAISLLFLLLFSDKSPVYAYGAAPAEIHVLQSPLIHIVIRTDEGLVDPLDGVVAT